MNDFDTYFVEAGLYIIEKNKASIGMLQRAFRIGFNRAYQIMNQLEKVGVVGKEYGTLPREIKMSKEEFDTLLFELSTSDSSSTTINRKNELYNNNFDYMEGYEFEHFCADLLKKNGFYNIEVTQCSGDHGIDILAEKDGITYAIQCKCYSSNIGNAAIQQAHTGKTIYHRDIAVVFTNRYFTAQAIEEANILGVKLWDRDTLNNMLVKISL